MDRKLKATVKLRPEGVKAGEITRKYFVTDNSYSKRALRSELTKKLQENGNFVIVSLNIRRIKA